MSAFSLVGLIPIVGKSRLLSPAERLRLCERHVGQILPITCEKDWDMELLFDDKARQVERDTGRVLSCNSRENPGEEDRDACFCAMQPPGATNAKAERKLSSDISDANGSTTQSRRDLSSRNRR